jgi:hypothetical protein
LGVKLPGRTRNKGNFINMIYFLCGKMKFNKITLAPLSNAVMELRLVHCANPLNDLVAFFNPARLKSQVYLKPY